jgi:hypothetical protein
VGLQLGAALGARQGPKRGGEGFFLDEPGHLTLL